MTLTEVAASALTLISVILTVRLQITLYPVGIAATLLYFFVFWRADLYASAGLQVYFTLIQVYGWWFWRCGNRGSAPRIGDWPWRVIALLAAPAAALTIGVAWALDRYTDARLPLGDTSIFFISVLAQFLLDRKQLKNWFLWGAADVISIAVYALQGLWLTTALYALLLANVMWGLASWQRAERGQEPTQIRAPA